MNKDERMIRFDRVHDISIRLGVESAGWPGDPPYERKLISSVDEGRLSTVSLLSMTTHVGTHIDTPAHFLSGAAGLDDCKPEDFILPAVVVDAKAQTTIGPELVIDAEPPRGGAILFPDGAHLSPAAARACVDSGVRMVGIDYFTVDPYGSDDFPAHKVLLEAGAVILETINLRDVSPGAYTLICLPLHLAGAEASPVRAVLLE
jgi:arylformamidase